MGLVVMPVVNIRIVTMCVNQRLVSMPVGMRLARRVFRSMCVPVMLIVHVGMFVLECFMNVLMQVTLAEVEPHSQQHEYCPKDKKRC